MAAVTPLLSGARRAAVLTFCLAVVLGRAEGPSVLEESAADTALRPLEKRVGIGSDPAKLRRDLAAFRVAHPGTRAAVRAAAFLGRLPSPLDRIDPKAIPEIEKFDWQPKELVGVLGEHRGRHGATVTSVAVSHDGAVVASIGSHLVRLWNTQTMRLIGLAGVGSAATSVALTKDGKHLVAGTAYGTVYVFSLPPGKAPVLRFSVSAATSAVYEVACHPDSKTIGAACFDNVVRLYDISGKALKETGQVSGHTKAVTCLSFSPDGKSLATGSEDHTARIWDLTTPDYKERSQLQEHTAPLRSVAFSPSGKSVATGCADGSFSIWTVPAAARAKIPRIFHQGPKGPVTSLAFSTSGNTLAATCGDNSVRLWNITTPKVRERFKLDGHAMTVRSVAYTPDMKLLVSGGDDWTVRTWDLTKAKPVERFEPANHLSHVYSVAFAPDDATLASGSLDRWVRQWDLGQIQPRPRKPLKGEAVPIYAVAYSPDGKLLAAGGQTTKVRQWEPASGAARTTLTANPTHVSQLVYSPDGKRLLVRSGTEAILYEAVRGEALHKLDKHETNVLSIGFSPDGKQVVTGSGYYLRDKDNKYVYKDGKNVWTDCLVRAWDTEKGEEVGSIKAAEPQTGFYAAAFTADGKGLLTSNYDGALRTWSVEGAKFVEKHTQTGTFANPVVKLIPTADGQRVLTFGSYGQFAEWDAGLAKKLRQWSLPEQVGTIAVTADGRYLAVGLATGVIYVLRLRDQEK